MNINYVVYNIFESKDLPGYSRGQAIARTTGMGTAAGTLGGMAGGVLGRFLGKKMNKSIRNRLEQDLKKTRDPVKKKKIQRQLTILQNKYDNVNNNLKTIGKDAAGGALLGTTLGAGLGVLNTAGTPTGARFRFTDPIGKRIFKK